MKPHLFVMIFRQTLSSLIYIFSDYCVGVEAKTVNEVDRTGISLQLPPVFGSNVIVNHALKRQFGSTSNNYFEDHLRQVGRYLGVVNKKSINGNFGNRSKCLSSEVRNVNIQENVVSFEIMKRKEILTPNQSEKYCILWATDSAEVSFLVKLCSSRTAGVAAAPVE